MSSMPPRSDSVSDLEPLLALGNGNDVSYDLMSRNSGKGAHLSFSDSNIGVADSRGQAVEKRRGFSDGREGGENGKGGLTS